jgi:hypothetical protein
MVKSTLGFSRKCRFGHLLILAAAMGWVWASAGAALPLPAEAAQRGPAMAAQSVARAAVTNNNDEAAPPSESPDQTQAKPAPSEGGRRDPFLIPKEPKGGPLAEQMEGAGPLPPGKRGLIISQLRLEGTVRQAGGRPAIAVVTNTTNRAYFLRENDEVYNGVVSKITPDSIYFTENVRTPGGPTTSREVIKRLGSGPGENR